MRTINLLRPYRGWVSGRELWQPGEYVLNEDAARHLVNGLYATYSDKDPIDAAWNEVRRMEANKNQQINAELPRVELYREMKAAGYSVNYRMKRDELIALLEAG